MSKTCIKCGAELEENAIFCDECGTKQTSATNEAADTPNTPSAREKSAKDEKNLNMGLVSFIIGIFNILTLGSFFLLIVVGIICGILGRQDKTKKHGLATAGFVLSLISAAMMLFI